MLEVYWQQAGLRTNVIPLYVAGLLQQVMGPLLYLPKHAVIKEAKMSCNFTVRVPDFVVINFLTMLLFRPVARECDVPTQFSKKVYLLPQNDSKVGRNLDIVVGDVQKAYFHI